MMNRRGCSGGLTVLGLLALALVGVEGTAVEGIAPASGKSNVVSHRAPGIASSKDFTVWVDGVEIFTGKAGNKEWRYSFCAFDFSEPVTVRVQALRGIKWLDLLPSILGVPYKTIDDYTFEFRLEEPEDITVLVNNDRNDCLHILTSLPEANRPNPDDDNVLFYKAGQTYDVGVLDLKDNQTLYIESGAKLMGMIRIRDAENVTIMGRGMIDGSDNLLEKMNSGKDKPWRLILMERARNVRIEGITLYNSLKWTVHPQASRNVEIENINILNWNYGSDGIDISASQEVRVANSFLRTNDDCIAVKALSFQDNMYYPSTRIQNSDTKGITVEGCTLWNMAYGNPFEIGFELRCARVGDIVFRDCDVLMQEDRGGVMTIHNSDNAVVEDILFDDIRVENANQTRSHKLFDIAILFSMWSYDRFDTWEKCVAHRYNNAWDNLLPVLPGKEAFHASHRGHVRNVHFRNIQVLDGRLPYSVLNGYDAEHLVEDITFENITVQGRKITNAEELKLFTKFARGIEIK
jgi:hypothetical protein